MTRKSLGGLAWMLGVGVLPFGCGGRTALDVTANPVASGTVAEGGRASGGESSGNAPTMTGGEAASGGGAISLPSGGEVSGGGAGSPAGGIDPGSGAAGLGPICGPGELACPTASGLSCVNVQRDANNCGACDHECAIDAYCLDGVCRALACTSTLLLGGLPLVDMGGSSVALALADLDGDGRLDITTGSDSGGLTLGFAYGRGGGLFAPVTQVPATSDVIPHAVLPIDLDGHDTLDLVVADHRANFVRLHYDLGGGSTLLLETGDGPTAATTGDFDGDGRLDIAVANEGSGSVTVLLQDPSLFSWSRADYPVAGSPWSIAAGDVSGDGMLDLVVAAIGDDDDLSTVGVLEGAADGTFGARRDYTTDATTRSVALVDYDGDGRLDIAHADFATETIGLLLAAPDGLTRAGELPVGAPPWFVTAGDLNHDDRPDLVVVNGYSAAATSSVSVLLATGEGSYAPAQDYRAVDYATVVAIGDVTGDGHVDLAVTNYDWHSVSILVGRGDGTFATQEDYPTVEDPTAVAAADLDGDGTLDLAIAGHDPATIALHRSAPAEPLESSDTYAVSGTVTDLALADLNGDARLDLVGAVLSAQSVEVLLSSGEEGFARGVSYPVVPSPYIFSGPVAVAVGDLDGDGAPDLVTANYQTEPIPSTVSVLLNQSDGTFASHVEYPVDKGPVDVAIAELTGDGIVDLAVANYDSYTLLLLPGRGDGSFGPALALIPMGARALAVADLDRDGRQDLVAASDHDVSVLLARPDGTLAPPVEYEASQQQLTAVLIADLDPDGIPDLLALGYTASVPERWGTLAVLRGNGDGTFAPKVAYVAGSGPRDLVAGDLDGDGRPDLVVINAGTSTFTVLRNTCY